MEDIVFVLIITFALFEFPLVILSRKYFSDQSKVSGKSFIQILFDFRKERPILGTLFIFFHSGLLVLALLTILMTILHKGA